MIVNQQYQQTEFNNSLNYHSPVKSTDQSKNDLSKLNSLHSLKNKLNINLIDRYGEFFPSYRQQDISDKNAILKILTLSLLEVLYTSVTSRQMFEASLFQLVSFQSMVRCQNNTPSRYSLQSIQDLFDDFTRFLFDNKSNNSDDIQAFYTIIESRPQFGFLLILIARGIVLEFYDKNPKIIKQILSDEELKSQRITSTLTNFYEDCNLENHTIVELACIAIGRKLCVVDSKTLDEQIYPYRLDTGPKQTTEFLIFDYPIIYWLNKIEQTDATPSKDIINSLENRSMNMSTQLKSQSNSTLNSPNIKSPDTSSHFFPQSENVIPRPGHHNGSTTSTMEYPKKKLDNPTPVPRPTGDDDLEVELMEQYCMKCKSTLTKLKSLRAYHCKNCQRFVCDDCGKFFNQRTETCKCQRCVICFLEYCKGPPFIGIKCQSICHQCFEEGSSETFNLVKYKCGHSLCRFCLYINKINRDYDPNICSLCFR